MSLYKITEQKLYQRRYAQNTIDNYLMYIDEFESKTGKHHSRLNSSDFQNYINTYDFSSASKQNIVISALKFSWEQALGKKYLKIDFTRPRKHKKLPRIIDAEFMAEKIRAIPNLKHRTILTIGLSCGLRISEVQNLKWEHLDRDRNILNVIQGKGNKDRCCLLNDDTIELLDTYYRKFKHIDKFLSSKEYVFTGQNNPKYSQTSIQNIVKKYIHRKEAFHCLRHSYCTYAIDNGTGTKALSISMGHNSVRTIEQTYFHQSTRTLKTIRQAI